MEPEHPLVLVDTNIWISAFINPSGPPGRVLGALLGGRFRAVVCPESLDELRDVASRPRIRRRYRLTEPEIEFALTHLDRHGILVAPRGLLRLCRDPDDDILLEAAIEAKAQFAVTRDDDLKRDPDLMAHLRRHGVAS